MAQQVEVPFATQEGNTGVSQHSQETLVNMFAEQAIGGRTQLIRRQRPCLERVLDLSGEKRCIERHNGVHYLVVGPTLYSFDGTSTTTLGTLVSNAGRCTMIFNDNDEVMVSDGAVGYYWDGTTFGITALPDGVSCGTLGYIAGFGVFNNPGTGQFYITALNDFSTVDALDFATAESAPDPIVRVFVDHNELWLIGDTTIEPWQLSGGADFPFTPLGNAQLERGCAAAFSPAAEDNTLFFLGDDGIVYRADGYRPVRVSTHAIEDAINDIPKEAWAAAHGWVYTSRGHKFYTLTFPGYATFQFNMATNWWNRAATFGFADWRVIGSAGHHSDYYLTLGGICRLKTGLNTDEGETVYRGGKGAPGWAGGKNLIVRSFFLDAEVGGAPLGVDAQVMMRVARDGVSFGNERWRSLGETGDYKRRAIWRNLGMGHKPTVEIGVTGDFEFTILSTLAEIDVAAF